jgi:hypothetical protein
MISKTIDIHTLPPELLLNIFSITYYSQKLLPPPFNGFSRRQVELLRSVCKYWCDLLREENFRCLEVTERSISRILKFIATEEGSRLSKLFKVVWMNGLGLPAKILGSFCGAMIMKVDSGSLRHVEPLKARLSWLILTFNTSECCFLQSTFSNSIGSLRNLDIRVLPCSFSFSDLEKLSRFIERFSGTLETLAICLASFRSKRSASEEIPSFPSFPALRSLTLESVRCTTSLEGLSILSLFPNLSDSSNLKILNIEAIRIGCDKLLLKSLQALVKVNLQWSWNEFSGEPTRWEDIRKLVHWVSGSRELNYLRLGLSRIQKWEDAPVDILEPLQGRKVHLIIQEPPCNHYDCCSSHPKLERIPKFEKLLVGLRCISFETWDPRIFPPRMVELLDLKTINFDPVSDQLELLARMIDRGEYPKLRGLKVSTFNQNLKETCHRLGIEFLFGDSDRINNDWRRLFLEMKPASEGK